MDCDLILAFGSGTVVPCCLDKEGMILWGILQNKYFGS